MSTDFLERLYWALADEEQHQKTGLGLGELYGRTPAVKRADYAFKERLADFQRFFCQLGATQMRFNPREVSLPRNQGILQCGGPNDIVDSIKQLSEIFGLMPRDVRLLSHSEVIVPNSA